jgi:parvulin-like peptidyl-prolyl isomerase
MPRFLLSTLLGATLLAACQKPASSGRITLDLQHPPQGTPVATFNGGAITVEDLNKQLANLPPSVRMRFQGPAQKKDYVEGLARVELLSREAVRRGLQNDPDVVETVKKVLAQKALQQEMEQKAPQPTEAEMQAFYDSHSAEFARPELVQLQDIFLAADAHGNDQRRAEKKVLADKLRAQGAKLKADDEKGFGDLARANSDDVLTKSTGGDLHPVPLSDLQARYGPTVAEAAKALQTPGAISPVVVTDKGFHILRLKSRTPARTQPFAEVKAQIRNRLFTERRNAANEAFLSRLKTEANYKLDEAALAQVNLAPTTAPPGHPTVAQPAPAGGAPTPVR